MKEFDKKQFYGKEYLEVLTSCTSRNWTVAISGDDDKGHWAIWKHFPDNKGLYFHFTGPQLRIDDVHTVQIDY